MKKFFFTTLVLIISLVFLLSCKKSDNNENLKSKESSTEETSDVEGQSGGEDFQRDPLKSGLYFYPHEFRERGLKFFSEENYSYEKNTSEGILEAASFENQHLSIGIIYLNNEEAAKKEFVSTATVLKERFELNNSKIKTTINTEDTFAFEVEEEMYVFMMQVDNSVLLAANADVEGLGTLKEALKDLGYI